MTCIIAALATDSAVSLLLVDPRTVHPSRDFARREALGSRDADVTKAREIRDSFFRLSRPLEIVVGASEETGMREAGQAGRRGIDRVAP